MGAHEPRRLAGFEQSWLQRAGARRTEPEDLFVVRVLQTI
jgi:hypothetical protein